MYHFLSAPGGSEQVCVVCEIIRMCTFLKYHIKMYKDHVFWWLWWNPYWYLTCIFFEHKEMCTFLKTFALIFEDFHEIPIGIWHRWFLSESLKSMFFEQFYVSQVFLAITRNCQNLQILIDFIRKSHSYWFSVWGFGNSGQSMKITYFFKSPKWHQL